MRDRGCDTRPLLMEIWQSASERCQRQCRFFDRNRARLRAAPRARLLLSVRQPPRPPQKHLLENALKVRLKPLGALGGCEARESGQHAPCAVGEVLLVWRVLVPEPQR